MALEAIWVHVANDYERVACQPAVHVRDGVSLGLARYQLYGFISTRKGLHLPMPIVRKVPSSILGWPLPPLGPMV